jgi:hypothetical protein
MIHAEQNENMNDNAALKGVIAMFTGLLGLSAQLMEFAEVIKLAVGVITLLGATFALGCGVYDRFFKGKKRRTRH